MDPNALPFYVAVIAYGLIASFIGEAIGARKGRPFAGFFLGLMLGPIGWLLVAVGPDEREKPVAPPLPQPAAETHSADDRMMRSRQLVDIEAIKVAATKESQRHEIEQQRFVAEKAERDNRQLQTVQVRQIRSLMADMLVSIDRIKRRNPAP